MKVNEIDHMVGRTFRYARGVIDMADFTERFEMQRVLSYLKSSAYIEEQLRATYVKPDFYRVEYRGYKRNMPLLVRELYLAILALERLPSVQEFEDAYQRGHRIKEKDYFSEKTAVRKAYNSLVRDLHFYYLLMESGEFDDVDIQYRFDLQAQTDILLRKGDKRLGLQLFGGGRNIKEMKQQHYRKHGGMNNYELLYFGTSGKGERKRLITASGDVFTLYSESDVDLVHEALMGSVDVRPSLSDENFGQFDEFVESTLPFPAPRMPHGEARHSVLNIGELPQTIIEQRKTECRDKGITYHHCEIKDHPPLTILDGKGFAAVEPALKAADPVGFNIEQYKVEHESSTADIAVMAGAGSGKTHTLVSRVLFLLDMGYVEHVHEVAMITFTNEAANNILQKLSERFMKLFKETSDGRFLRYLEELREMRIMTIPAFAKFILKQYGHHIGLGQNMKISALTMKRREFMEQHIDEVYSERGFAADLLKGMEYYQLREFMEAFASKLEQKGVSASGVLDAKKPEGPFGELMLGALSKVEDSLRDYKQERDILGLSDLATYMKRLMDSERSMKDLRKKIRYLFIDEFQDTDGMQIDFLVGICARAHIPLLTVGDIKQGIYRFRGANVTAFQIISERLAQEGRTMHEHTLVKNYRTAGDLLTRIEGIFSGWRAAGHLENDTPMKPVRAPSVAAESFIEFQEPADAEEILRLYKKMTERPRVEDEGKRILSILVRTNREVGQVNELLTAECSERNIPIQVVKEGTLFSSAAAKDLNILLNSWLESEDTLMLFELSQTAYCKTTKAPELIIEGNVYRMEDIVMEIPNGWEEALGQFKLAPANIVLSDFITGAPFKEHLQEKMHGDVDGQYVKQYTLNLQKILTLMNNALQEGQADLYSIQRWLSIEIATNNRDDEAELTEADFSRDYLKVMTVHKSKGLEFDTVVLPFIHEQFVPAYNRNREILVETDGEQIDYAWRISTGTKTREGFEDMTSNFESMMEDERPQILKEEARNLYVALTRAKECLAVFDIGKPISSYQRLEPNTWHHLMKGGN